MSIATQNLLTAPDSRINSFYFKTPKYTTHLPPLKRLKTPLNFSTQKPHLQKIELLRCHQWKVKALESEGSLKAKNPVDYEFNVDAFLSILEFLCLVSSAVTAIGCVVNSWFLGSQKWLGNRVLAGQFVLLVSGMVIGSVIRRRQWRRICVVDLSRSGNGSRGVNLLERIEKLEEDLRSSTTILRVLSRQLEKLGIRFRVTRKTLKEPITEAATLAQKNSEATRTLAVQGEVLEKELGEIQKVLLAMQEQQYKQLELILAIGKAGKLLDNEQGTSQDRDWNTSDVSNNTTVGGVPKLGVNQVQALAGQREANIEKS